MSKLRDDEQYQTRLPFYDDIDVSHFKRRAYWKGFLIGTIGTIFYILFGYIYIHS